jgi:hypothetical protein
MVTQRRTLASLLAVVVAVSGAATRAAEDAKPKPTPPELSYTLQKKGDRVTAKISADEALYTVDSPTGIGRLELVRKSGAWPKKIVLRLGLKDLEGFSAGNGDLEFRGNLGQKLPEVSRIDKDEKRTAVDNDGRYTMPIRRVGDRIEVVLPSALFPPEVKSLKVQWIDYYR